MRQPLLISVILVVSAVSAAIPAAAFADEPLQVNAPAAAAVTKPDLGFVDRPQFVLSLDGNTEGFGVRIGLRYSVAEVMFGADLDGDWGGRSFGGLKLHTLPSTVVAPYTYAKIGHWEKGGFFAEDHTGDFWSFGGGIEVRPSPNMFLFAEVGYEQRTGDKRPEDDSTGVEAGLGFGFRM